MQRTRPAGDQQRDRDVRRPHRDVNRDLLEIHDGPLTKALEDTDGKRIMLPQAAVNRPNRDFLAQRFEQFLKAA